MLNLIKMDLHRLFRIKSFWIMIVVTIALIAFNTYVTHYEVTELLANTSVSDMQTDEADIVIGFTVQTQAEWMNKVDFTDLVNSNFSGLFLAVLCAIFAPIFVNGDQKNGYIKNIAGQFSNKGMLVLSKLVAVAVQVLVIFAIATVSTALVGKLCWEDKLIMDSIGDFVKLFSIQYLLHFSFASLISAFTIILKSGGLAMTFGILSSTGITFLLYTLADILLHKCGVSEKFNIGNYSIEGCMKTFTLDFSGYDLARIIIVGVAFLIGSTAVSMLTMQKRDIR